MEKTVNKLVANVAKHHKTKAALGGPNSFVMTAEFSKYLGLVFIQKTKTLTAAILRLRSVPIPELSKH